MKEVQKYITITKYMYASENWNITLLVLPPAVLMLLIALLGDYHCRTNHFNCPGTVNMIKINALSR